MLDRQGPLTPTLLRTLIAEAVACKLTGVLKIARRDQEKRFFFQDGQIAFVASNLPGERIGEILAQSGALPAATVKEAAEASRASKTPFVVHLLERQLLPRQTLGDLLGQLATAALQQALDWSEGSFALERSTLPPALTGLFALSPAPLLKAGGEQRTELIKRITRKLAEGDFELPPMPDILVRLNNCMGEDGPSVEEIIAIIMNDQILTTKILKVVNSSFYALPAPVTSPRHAVVYIGFKAMLSIVTAHSLKQISGSNLQQVEGILRHSLECAFLAKILARRLRLDEEEAFICGLLHDVGKTVLANITPELAKAEAPLTPADLARLIQDYHTNAGALIALKWNLPEVVRNVVKFHHQPSQSPADLAMVELVFLANGLLNEPERLPVLQQGCRHLDLDSIDFAAIEEQIPAIVQSAASIL
jgi:putative nucleotidyltransferase with HDIG domain